MAGNLTMVSSARLLVQLNDRLRAAAADPDWLRDSVDDAGRSSVERGVDELGVPGWCKHALSLAAVTGFCTAAALGYFLPYGYASMSADTFVELPSYLAPDAYCGVAGKPACPSEYLHHLKDGEPG